jgi:bla regulator protein BlaR1
MIPIDLSPLANHLWQSSLFACVAALFALALRNNRAQTRYWVWMSASVKFLAPFSLLVGIGSRVEWRRAAEVAPPISSAIEQMTQPFTLPVAAVATPSAAPALPLTALLIAVWFCGIAVVLGRWFMRWRRIRIAVRSASPLPVCAPIQVMSSPTRLEPGVCGIFRPVLLLPEGIADRLTPAQFAAILAHELSHVRRRDNLVAGIHMVVEALFWFHPLVWWIGARMVEERERACDEEVLRRGSDPEVYAAGILKVCRLYLESGLACAAGVTGADLKKRIEAIMTNRIVLGMTFTRKLLLAAAGVAAVAGPIGIGIINAPRSHAQTQAGLKFEVASVKPADPNLRGMRLNITPGNGLLASGVTLKTLVEFAYDVQDFQISGGPGWMRTDRYEILAKPDRPEESAESREATEAQRKVLLEHLRERTRALLAERFQLSVHRESEDRPVYILALAKNGHKLQEPTEQTGITRNRGLISGNGATVEMLAHVLGFTLGRPVLDRTGVTGTYKFKMEWTEESVGMKEKGGAISTDATPADPLGPSIFSAIQEQLGLKLEAGKGPVEIIVIDRAEKPTAN